MSQVTGRGGVSHIVYDAYGKSVLGDPCFQVFEHVNNLAGGVVSLELRP